MKRLIIMGLMLLLIPGCFTGSGVIKLKRSDVIRFKNEGISRIYPVNEDQAWKIAKMVFHSEATESQMMKQILRLENIPDIEEYRTEGYMLTSTGSDTLTTSGTVMGAWIEAIDKNNTLVTVVTKRRVATNLITSLTEATFHKRFAEAVEIIKRGNRLK
jgi:hypothetical protein